MKNKTFIEIGMFSIELSESVFGFGDILLIHMKIPPKNVL